VIRREYDRWMVKAPNDTEEEDHDDADADP
jgi:hypothetical protein